MATFLKRRISVLLFAFFVCGIFLFGFFLGKLENVQVSDIQIFLNGQKQIFRDVEGHRVSVIEYDNNIYIPINILGTYLGYNIENNEGNISLSDIEGTNIVKNKVLDLDTFTLNGDRFTTDNLYIYDYTILLNWATWCPDCKVFINSLTTELKDNNIQIVGLPIYDKSAISIEDKRKEVESILSENNIYFENLIVTKDMENSLQTNIENIPSVIIVNKKAQIVENIEFENLSFKNILEEIEKSPNCDKC